MAKLINTYTNSFKIFGITLFEITQKYYEISTENSNPEIDDEIILRERIEDIKKKEKRKWFR